MIKNPSVNKINVKTSRLEKKTPYAKCSAPHSVLVGAAYLRAWIRSWARSSRRRRLARCSRWATTSANMLKHAHKHLYNTSVLCIYKWWPIVGTHKEIPDASQWPGFSHNYVLPILIKVLFEILKKHCFWRNVKTDYVQLFEPLYWNEDRRVSEGTADLRLARWQGSRSSRPPRIL